jgi:hypothetical protein
MTFFFIGVDACNFFALMTGHLIGVLPFSFSGYLGLIAFENSGFIKVKNEEGAAYTSQLYIDNNKTVKS